MNTATSPRQRKTKYRSRYGKYGYFFILPFFLVFVGFILFSIVFTFYISLHKWTGYTPMEFVGLKNYVRILTTDAYFLKSVLNTLILTLEFLPISIILGLVLAVLLFNRHIRAKRFYQVVNFLPYIVTPVAIGVLFSVLFDWSSGTINQVLLKLGIISEGINWLGRPFTARLVVSLLMIWRIFGYCMVVYLAGLTRIPSELYEAAEVDGASGLQRFFRITLPLLRPITQFLVITGIIMSLQMFDAPKILFGGNVLGPTSAGGPDRSVLTGVWYLYDVAFGRISGTPRFGLGSAVAYGLFVIIAFFSLLSFRLTKGTGED
jgi:cellobiose transport system permease protein